MNSSLNLKRKWLLIGAVALAAWAGLCNKTFAADAPRIKYDNQCLTIDGKDTFIFSGAFHYFRCPKELWPARFAKLQEAGFNTLEAYTAWNWHERSKPAGVDDFSQMDMTDLHDWLAMAIDQFGFNVYLRPGPYICAEWDGGGYPQWLVTEKPAGFTKVWLRGDEASYLAWCKHWYTAVAKVAVPFQITHRPVGKPGIILWQIENEYNYSQQPTDVKIHQLDFLAHASRDLGIDVPLTTCMTNNAEFRKDQYLVDNVIETRNTYPKFSSEQMGRDITMLEKYQPEKFRMISELQGGWFAQVGGKLSEEQGFDASHINHVTLFAWEHGFTSTSYYMGFGGTNLGDWAAAGLTTTYDYDAPVREPGGVTSRYFAVQALGNFLKEHSAQLVRSTEEKFETRGKVDPDVNVAIRRAADGSRFVFVRTDVRDDGRKGQLTLLTSTPDSQITVNYELGSFGSKVLYLPPGATSDSAGSWYPKAVEGPKRPAESELPASVKITEARMQVDPGPETWKPLQPGQSEEDAGIYHRGFVFYRVTVPQLTTKGDERIAFSGMPQGHDWAAWLLNGKRITPDPKQGNYTLTSSDSGAKLVGLYENWGRPNGGGLEMERPCGITDLRIALSENSPRELTDWRMKLVEGRRRNDDFTDKIDDSSWAAVDISGSDGTLEPKQSAIYRTHLEVSSADLQSPKVLTLGRVDDEGTVYVNGAKVGDCRDWDKAQRFEITRALHPGKNLIAVYVNNRDGVGGLARRARFETEGPSIPAGWEISDQTAGVAGKWWDNTLDDSSWKPVALGEGANPTDPQTAPLLTWYRVKFDLPTPKPTQWVPWKINLSAVGNGFLYLNGHPLGRWWQQGPQRDFYLPDCWLNFGPGKTNVLTISLRPTDAPPKPETDAAEARRKSTEFGVALKSAEVSPYANLAEEK